MIFKKWSKIPQFRGIIQTVQMAHDHAGKDDLGNAIYKNTSPYPIIKFEGTVKLHGTNAQISYSKEEGILVGKRSSLIGKDQLGAHFGFNQFVQVQYQQEFIDWFKVLEEIYALDNKQLIIYGEWAGEGIQKGVAISQLPKSFYIFGVKTIDSEGNSTEWMLSELPRCPIERVHNLSDFPTYNIDIDFNNPKASQNALIDITNAVEAECPVAAKLDVKGVGEGVVWSGRFKNQELRFKVKGEKHAVSGNKIKTLASIDPIVLKNIQEFVDHVVTVNRVQQGIQVTETVDRKGTGNFLQWICKDIIEEESDVLKASGLEWKQVVKAINYKARLMLFVELDKL